MANTNPMALAETAAEIEGTVAKIDESGKKVTDSFSAMQKGMEGFASKVKSFAATLTATVLGSVSVGDWRAWADFKASLQVLTMLVGQILTPVIKDFTEWLKKLSSYINSLSPITKSLIAGFSKWAIVLSSLAVIGIKVIPIIQSLGSAIASLGPLGLAAAAGLVLAGVLMARQAANEQKTLADVERRQKEGINATDVSQHGGVFKGLRTAEDINKKIIDLEKERVEDEKKLNSGWFGTGVGAESRRNVGAAFGEEGKQSELIGQMSSLLEARREMERTGKSLDEVLAGARNKKAQDSMVQNLQNQLLELNKPSQLMGIADAWKAAMQQNVETPESRKLQKILEELQTLNTKQKENPVGTAP